MTDLPRAYTADDLTDAFWRGYEAAKAENGGGAFRRPIPRGWAVIMAVCVSLLMWALIFAAIAPRLGVILVNSASAKRAEDLLSTLREAIGSLPVRPATVKIAPVATMTEWVKSQEAAEGFYVLDECELRDTAEDGGIVRCKRQDLTGEEIQLHLSTGKVVTQLALAWQDKLSFILDDKMVIKRLKFEELLQEQAEQDGGDEAAQQFDASFQLMMMTFAEFLPVLFEALGGEEIPQGV